MKQKILVITATLGNRDSLRRTIESVKAVGRDDVRHVIICPEKAIETIKCQFDNIDCLAEPAGKKGIYPALNHGFKTLGKDYDYLTFINDDDYWLPDYRVLIDAVLRDDRLDMVYARTRYVDENNVVIGSQASYGRFNLFIALLKGGIVMLTQQATLIKSKLYFKVGGFDESFKLVSDSKFWAKLSQMNICYKYFDTECAAYMIQDGQLSSNHELQRTETEIYLRDFKCSNIKVCCSKLLYRIHNIPLYVKRIMKKGKLTNPFVGGVKIATMFLPWRIKRAVLQKVFGFKLAPSAHIGFAYVFPKYLEMKDGAHISHMTVAVHLDRIVMGENSSIGRSNWITGFPTGTNSPHFSHDYNRKSELIIGRESAITKSHHIDCTNSVKIGDYVTIAGYRSQFLTHSIDIYKCRQDSHSITIGDYCFVSTSVIILGGAVLPAHSVLAANATLNKSYEEQYMMYAGVPAKPKKRIENAKYFERERGYVF